MSAPLVSCDCYNTSLTSQTFISLTFKAMVSSPFSPPEPTPTFSPRLSFSFFPMNNLSLFLIKNSFASKMKKGIRNFCNGVGSTSTLNQSNVSCIVAPSLSGSNAEESNLINGSPKTLEEMLLQLDLEEASAARRTKLEDYGELNRRMSCVNNSDILRCARNALNQYPRFSLDGRDAMYRSTFRNFGTGNEGGRRSVCCREKDGVDCELDMERSFMMPPTVAGERVVWCKPGVVAKLMGLDAVPVPVKGRSRHGKRRSSTNVLGSKNRNLRRMGRYELEKERIAMNMKSSCSRARLSKESLGSNSVALTAKDCGDGEDWQFRRAR